MPLRGYPVGKLPPSVLEAILKQIKPRRNSGVILGPRFGEDAAVLDFGTKYLIAKSDPITFAADRIGWYAVNVNANDVAAMGARPRWFLATLLLPQHRATSRLAQSIFVDVQRACRALSIHVVGGHTEITARLDRPIVGGHMLGEVEKDKLVRKDRQRPGDIIVLTKGIAIEGTAILARERRGELTQKLGAVLVRRAWRLLFEPGISVVRDALAATKAGEIHAMHDPTEGGLLSGLYELARAGDVGLRVWKERVPVLNETRAFSQVLGFDPFALIASGALLIVVSRGSVRNVLKAFEREKILAAVIGEIRPKREDLTIEEAGRVRPLRVLERDEIARLVS
jgi:hydrogenase maturation factor